MTIQLNYEAAHLDSNPSTTLRAGLSLRPVQWTDLQAVAKLIYDVCEADGDVTVATSPEDLANIWKNEGFSAHRWI
jgi:hypothetical protein